VTPLDLLGKLGSIAGKAIGTAVAGILEAHLGGDSAIKAVVSLFQDSAPH